MTLAPPKRQRCAIYTRKSTEHNLDLAFNSLDAQREACEAYIKCQAHEGWTLVRERFDDGGLSGASLERPALQDLLNRVRARQIDVIVVYKVDRLTRSLADFAKLVELLDAHDASFVSVTQSFNTTSSMGRLTLNVLLSFAQFEREVIGERVRDKVAASKRRGIWVGGPVPLGYRSVGKKLEVVPEEAALVRKIFSDYLRLGSIGALAASLNAEGLKPKPRRLANCKTVQAACFRVGPLAHLLKNRFYLGVVIYRNEIYRGEHASILDKELFEAVQERLKEQTVERSNQRLSSPALLAGKLFDDRGDPMTPTYTNKKGVRYRYYVSHALLQGQKIDAGSVARVSAPGVEKLVIDALRVSHDTEPDASDRELIDRALRSATVGRDSIAIQLNPLNPADGVTEPSEVETLLLPFSPPVLPRKGVTHAPATPAGLDEAGQTALLSAIARTRRWIEMLRQDPSQSFADIAEKENLTERHVRFLARLAFLSPRIVEAIVGGHAPADLTASGLARGLSLRWAEQEAAFGLSRG
jgi:site-specific DNA recombinase